MINYVIFKFIYWTSLKHIKSLNLILLNLYGFQACFVRHVNLLSKPPHISLLTWWVIVMRTNWIFWFFSSFVIQIWLIVVREFSTITWLVWWIYGENIISLFLQFLRWRIIKFFIALTILSLGLLIISHFLWINKFLPWNCSRSVWVIDNFILFCYFIYFFRIVICLFLVLLNFNRLVICYTT